MEDLEHIKYAKNVLSQRDFEELQEYIGDDVDYWPSYNFKPKDVPPRNKIEKAIVKLIGQDNHVEYWIRNPRGQEPTLWHVDANELFMKKYISENDSPEEPQFARQFPLNTHILYISVDPKMEGGELLILPNNTYVEGRPINDTNYQPLDSSRMLIVKPKENHLVFFNKPIYHATNEYKNIDPLRRDFRVSLMFSSWDYIPKPYDEWHHWNNPWVGIPAEQLKWPKGA